MAVELGLLGEVTAHVDGRAVELGTPRQRCVLAALAVDVGRVVPAERLMQRVWGADTPRRGRATLHSHISRLRQVLPAADGVEIVLRSGGYALVVDQEVHAVDLHRFHDLCARARGTDDDRQRVALLTEALALWRGEPLTGLSGEWVHAERDRMRQEVLAAGHDLVDARLRVGHGEELVAELSVRTAQYPLDERAAGQYLLALYRAGRSADALEHYQRLRERLVEELGADPGAPLQELHQRILAADPTLSAPPGSQVVEPVVVARQLPAAPPHFTGRDTDLAALTATLDTARQGRMVVISAIAGAGGIGKTWLAVHWAHKQRVQFPDGQLFVDLRGFSPDSEPMAPTVVVRGFLDALGVEPGRIPVEPQAQAGLFRSLVADKRMLIVLDNAAHAEQVMPLLPGGDACTVVVTSRRTLTGLVTRHGAHHLTLDTLSSDEARTLLTQRLGTARVTAEPEAVAQLVDLCGGFPLALGIIAGRALTHPRAPLAVFAAELRDLGLGALEDDDPATDLPTVLSWSYRALTTEQQVVFGLLGIAPGPDISLPAAASLTGLPPALIGKVLRGLEEASLLGRDAHGRYTMHDLIRRYATDHSAHDLTGGQRDAALRRVTDFYLHTAFAADRLLDPHRQSIELAPPCQDYHPRLLADQDAATAWLTAEHPNLLAAQRLAVEQGMHTAVWQLAWALDTFHNRQGQPHNRRAMWRAGLAAAEFLGDATTCVLAHRLLGGISLYTGQHDEAVENLTRALELAEHIDDRLAQAHTHHVIARVWEEQEQDQRALHHAVRALHLFQGLDQPVWHAIALNAVGWMQARQGDYEPARAHCEAALDVARTHRLHHEVEAATLDSLGYIAHQTGHHTTALSHYEHALTLYRDLSETYYAADTLNHLGDIHHALDLHDQARSAWQEALELYRAQQRADEADRVQQQLDALDHKPLS
ncbi:tetratricopeptide repeat protein [Lentzea tibetensis]|uniref:Tetratricopeptide repeat protein n=1 Tax=Lentzea tibetensis TaxID=2591470 RepID=A0A563F3I7_9PSEU|nr:BTAD domain-containing putative transcriptional regulator [Lentzea tibetensis]TWP54328.1 tetratricopeptide repeat protein [Lentzea tibetensis]